MSLLAVIVSVAGMFALSNAALAPVAAAYAVAPNAPLAYPSPLAYSSNYFSSPYASYSTPFARYAPLVDGRAYAAPLVDGPAYAAPIARSFSAPLVAAPGAYPSPVVAARAAYASPYVSAAPVGAAQFFGARAYATPYVAAPVASAPFVAAPVASAPLVSAPIVADARAVAFAAPLSARLEEVDAHPQYQYAYAVRDELTGDTKSQEETRDGGVVRGSYSLVEPDGVRRTVNYYADPINGFNAVVQRDVPVAVAAALKVAPAAVVV